MQDALAAIEVGVTLVPETLALAAEVRELVAGPDQAKAAAQLDREADAQHRVAQQPISMTPAAEDAAADSHGGG